MDDFSVSICGVKKDKYLSIWGGGGAGKVAICLSQRGFEA